MSGELKMLGWLWKAAIGITGVIAGFLWNSKH
jgi:hypothetical protein